MSSSIQIQIGGDFIHNGQVVKDVVGQPLVYQLFKGKQGNQSYIVATDTAALHGLFEAFMDRIGSQLKANQNIFATHYSNKIIANLQPILDFNYNNFIGESYNGQIVIRPSIHFYVASDYNGSNFRSELFFSSFYVPAESSGHIKFVAEFNKNSHFDNVHLEDNLDENFTNHSEKFINLPQFNLALFVRPKLFSENQKHRICRKCRRHCEKVADIVGGCEKCKSKCQRKHCENFKDKPFTNTAFLTSSVILIYQLCQRIQRKQITFEEGKKSIDEQVEKMSKYLSEGSAMYELRIDQDDNLIMLFCNRYNLKNTDCIVGFTMNGINDIFKGRPEAEFNEVLMGVSAVPIDEDMSDAVFPDNNGIFIYKRGDQ